MLAFFNAFLFILLQVIRIVLQIIRKAVDFSGASKGRESEARAAEMHLRWYKAGWKWWMEETAQGLKKEGADSVHSPFLAHLSPFEDSTAASRLAQRQIWEVAK